MARKGAEITQVFERNQEATVYCGNLDSRVDEELLWELFVQCGIVRNVHIPRDKVTGQHSNYGFVEFQQEMDAEYAMKILNMIKLFNKPIKCNKTSQDKRTQEVGANLFIGNLDIDVDDKLLYDTFSAFGNILSTKVMREPETGESRGFGFVSFDSFESSDAALAAMNGQFLCNKPVHVSYAYKKDTKGERHGSAAERLIASNCPKDILGLRPKFDSSVPPPPPMMSIPAPPSNAGFFNPQQRGMMPMSIAYPPGMPIAGIHSMPPGMPPPLLGFPPGMNSARALY